MIILFLVFFFLHGDALFFSGFILEHVDRGREREAIFFRLSVVFFLSNHSHVMSVNF